MLEVPDQGEHAVSLLGGADSAVSLDGIGDPCVRPCLGYSTGIMHQIAVTVELAMVLSGFAFPVVVFRSIGV